MYYNPYFTSESFDNNYKLTCEQIERNAKESADGYSYTRVSIIGQEAINKFQKITGARIEYNELPKTDGKTRAEVMHYISAEIYADMRGNSPKAHFGKDCFYTAQVAIKYNDQYYFYSRRYNEATGTLYPLHDRMNYRQYLPYNWEQQNPEPQKVGTVTDKKMEAWRTYWMEKHFAALQEETKRTNSARVFLSQVKTLAESCKHYYLGDNTGWIKQNGLMLSYSIDGSLNVSAKIELDIDVKYQRENLCETFAKMIKGEL